MFRNYCTIPHLVNLHTTFPLPSSGCGDDGKKKSDGELHVDCGKLPMNAATLSMWTYIQSDDVAWS